MDQVSQFPARKASLRSFVLVQPRRMELDLRETQQDGTILQVQKLRRSSTHEMSGRPAKSFSRSRAFQRTTNQHLCATSCDSELITITTITEQARARG
jgi:hypothetical protein